MIIQRWCVAWCVISLPCPVWVALQKEGARAALAQAEERELETTVRQAIQQREEVGGCWCPAMSHSRCTPEHGIRRA